MERNLSTEIDALTLTVQELQDQVSAIAAAMRQQNPHAAVPGSSPNASRYSEIEQALKGISNAVKAAEAEDLARLDRLIGGLPKQEPTSTVGHVEKMSGMHPLPEVNTILDQLENSCGADGSTGRITYMGVFASGGRQSTWVKNSVNTNDLLSLIENRTAEKVLACIGSNDRLNMLLAILRKPRTVAELVSDCGFSSTGQVYHHLKPLISADLVTEAKNQRGSYIIQPHRVQGVIMLLAGVSDLVDNTYTEGQLD